MSTLNAGVLEPGGPPAGDPGSYGLTYTLMYANSQLVSVRFDEYGFTTGAAAPYSAVRAFVFDMNDASPLRIESLLTPEGIAAVEARIQARIDAVVESEWILEPNALTQDVAVAPGGLIAYVDETDGLPHAIGPIEVVIPWSDLDGYEPPGGPLSAVDRSACSTSTQRWAMTAQDGLPDAVNAKRADVFSTAVSCDYAALAGLASDSGFTYSFGGGDDPAGFFADQEFRGTPLMRYLVATLNMSYSVIENPDGSDIYTWPGAFAFEWDATTEAQRAEIADLYGDDALDGYAEFGAFIGWRVGIDENGEWVFFVAGD